MIQSSHDCMDVVGTGHNHNQVYLLHYVLDEKCAAETIKI